MLVDVQLSVRGGRPLDETLLEQLQLKLAEHTGVHDPAVVYWPQDNELGIQFQVEEEILGQLLEPEAGRLAA